MKINEFGPPVGAPGARRGSDSEHDQYGNTLFVYLNDNLQAKYTAVLQ